MDTRSVKTNKKYVISELIFFNQNRMVSVIAKKLRDNRNHQGNIDQTVSINVDKISIQIIKKHYKWQVVRIYKINITVHFRDCSCSCVDDKTDHFVVA